MKRLLVSVLVLSKIGCGIERAPTAEGTAAIATQTTELKGDSNFFACQAPEQCSCSTLMEFSGERNALSGQQCAPNKFCCTSPPPACGDGACNSGETCGSCERDCGPCYDPNIINVSGLPRLRSMAELNARARALGVGSLLAGVPNIEAFLQRQSQNPVFLSYPTDATGVSDFMIKLFQRGSWASTPPGQSETPMPDDANCHYRQVDVTYQPDQLVSFDIGAGLLFPSALLQGNYISLGGDSIVPLHVPYVYRNPVYLLGSFYNGSFGTSAISPTSTATDVYTAIGQIIQRAQAEGLYKVADAAMEVTTASSFEEAATKFNLDAKIFGGSVTARFASTRTEQRNTVFVRFQQSLFSIAQDLRGFSPTQAQLGGNFTVADLQSLGDAGEIGYTNLPTYIRNVTYGRMLLFSLSSIASQSDLEAAANAVYGPNSFSASATQRLIVQNSTMRIFAYGGPFEPAEATIKSGNWQSYFTMTNIPLATLKPLGYEVRRFDDAPAAMSRTTQFTRRICDGAKTIRVQLSDTYNVGTIFVKPAGSTSYQSVAQTANGFVNVDITPFLAGTSDKIKVQVQVGSTDIFNPSHGHTKIDVFANDVNVKDSPRWSCNRCNSQDVRAFTVNSVTGQVEDSSLQ